MIIIIISIYIYIYYCLSASVCFACVAACASLVSSCVGARHGTRYGRGKNRRTGRGAGGMGWVWRGRRDLVFLGCYCTCQRLRRGTCQTKPSGVVFMFVLRQGLPSAHYYSCNSVHVHIDISDRNSLLCKRCVAGKRCLAHKPNTLSMSRINQKSIEQVLTQRESLT